jgi:hypothetical protein
LLITSSSALQIHIVLRIRPTTLQDARGVLLELADKYKQPIPFTNSPYPSRVELLAAQKEAALAAAGGREHILSQQDTAEIDRQI